MLQRQWDPIVSSHTARTHTNMKILYLLPFLSMAVSAQVDALGGAELGVFSSSSTTTAATTSTAAAMASTTDPTIKRPMLTMPDDMRAAVITPTTARTIPGVDAALPTTAPMTTVVPVGVPPVDLQ